MSFRKKFNRCDKDYGVYRRNGDCEPGSPTTAILNSRSYGSNGANLGSLKTELVGFARFDPESPIIHDGKEFENAAGDSTRQKEETGADLTWIAR